MLTTLWRPVGQAELDLIIENVPIIGTEIDIMFCWLNARPIKQKGRYILRHTTNEVKCVINDVQYKIDINSMERNTNDKNVSMNEIGRMSIKTHKPIYYDAYRKNRITGSIILIDEATNETVCAGMIV